MQQMKENMKNAILPTADILPMSSQNSEEAFKILCEKYWQLLLRYLNFSMLRSNRTLLSGLTKDKIFSNNN